MAEYFSCNMVRFPVKFYYKLFINIQIHCFHSGKGNKKRVGFLCAETKENFGYEKWLCQIVCFNQTRAYQQMQIFLKFNDFLIEQIKFKIQMQGKNKPEKMITFLDSLHQKYPVLTKLAEKQLSDFQNEVILLLVDENENVDTKLYRDVVHSIGLDAFVLEILSKSIKRSPFANQYEMKKNISSIAEELEIQVKQCNKRMKIIERKQTQISNRQANLKNKMREYMIQLEKDLANKLVAKQGQIKKTASQLINNLRGKQKLLIDRKQQINKRLQEMIVKQKSLITLQRQLERKCQNQSEIGQNLNQQNKVDGKLKQLRQVKQTGKKYEQLQLQVEKLRKKNKTTDMAYSKLKNDLVEKEKEIQRIKELLAITKKQLSEEKQKSVERQKQILQKIKLSQTQLRNQKHRGKIIKDNDNVKDKDKDGGKEKENERSRGIHKNNLKRLQYEVIDKAQNVRQFMTFGSQMEQKNKNSQLVNMLDLLDLSEIQNQNESKDHRPSDRLKSINMTTNQQNSNLTLTKKRKIADKQIEIVQAEQNILFFNNYFSKNKNSNSKIQNLGEPNTQILDRMQKSSNPRLINQPQQDIQFMRQNEFDISPHQIFQKIQHILSNSSSGNQNQLLLQSNLLLSFIRLPSYSLKKQDLSNYYDILLNLIQQSNSFYYDSIQYLGKRQFCDFFQNSYLNYESSLEIIQAATLLLSRVIMATTIQVKFKEQFIKAIKMRIKFGQSQKQEGSSGQSDSQQFLQANINCILSMVHFDE